MQRQRVTESRRDPFADRFEYCPTTLPWWAVVRASAYGPDHFVQKRAPLGVAPQVVSAPEAFLPMRKNASVYQSGLTEELPGTPRTGRLRVGFLG
jgi:hypothetical protein